MLSDRARLTQVPIRVPSGGACVGTTVRECADSGAYSLDEHRQQQCNHSHDSGQQDGDGQEHHDHPSHDGPAGPGTLHGCPQWVLAGDGGLDSADGRVLERAVRRDQLVEPVGRVLDRLGHSSCKVGDTGLHQLLHRGGGGAACLLVVGASRNTPLGLHDKAVPVLVADQSPVGSGLRIRVRIARPAGAAVQFR